MSNSRKYLNKTPNHYTQGSYDFNQIRIQDIQSATINKATVSPIIPRAGDRSFQNESTNNIKINENYQAEHKQRSKANSTANYKPKFIQKTPGSANEMSRFCDLLEEKNRQLNEWMSKYVYLEQQLCTDLESYKQDISIQMQAKYQFLQEELNICKIKINQEKQQLEDELNKAVKKVQYLEVENRQLTQQIQSQQRFYEKQQQQSQKSLLNQQQEEMNKANLNRTQQSQMSNMDLKIDLKSRRDENDELRLEVLRLKESENNLKEQLKNALQQKENQENQLKEKILDYDDLLRSFEQRKSRDLGTISKLNQDKKELQGEVDSKRSQINLLQNQIDTLNEQFQRLRSKDSRRESDVDQSEAFKNLKNDLDQRHSYMVQYYDNLKKDNMEEVNKYKDELQITKNQLIEAREQLQFAQQNHERIINELRQENEYHLKTIQNQMTNLMVSNHQLTEEVQTRKLFVDTAVSQVILNNEQDQEDN